MRYLRYALVGAAIVALAAIGVVSYIAAAFNPNAYKPQIIRLVQEKMQRTLRLDGDIRLALWPGLGADPDMKQDDLTLKARMSSPLSANIRTRQASLPGLVAGINASGPSLPGKGVSGEFAGGANIDGAGQSAQFSLTGKIADSNIKARIGVTGFAAPAIRFDVDRFDAARYLPPNSAAQQQPERLFDRSWLKGLRASGTLRIGSLTAVGVKASNVRLDIKPEGGRGSDRSGNP